MRPGALVPCGLLPRRQRPWRSTPQVSFDCSSASRAYGRFNSCRLGCPSQADQLGSHSLAERHGSVPEQAAKWAAPWRKGWQLKGSGCSRRRRILIAVGAAVSVAVGSVGSGLRESGGAVTVAGVSSSVGAASTESLLPEGGVRRGGSAGSVSPDPMRLEIEPQASSMTSSALQPRPPRCPCERLRHRSAELDGACLVM